MKKVAVVGLGYVGLPLALLAEEKGFDVVGVEVSQKKLSSLKNKQPIIDDETANKRLKKTRITFTDSFEKLADRDVVIICVPTPVDEKKMPDISLVEKAVESSVKHMKTNSLLVVESTINPGVCDEVVIPLIEKSSPHKVGESIYLAHCPERINPGDPKWHVDNINRVVGGDSKEGLESAYAFYADLIDAKIKKMGSLKEAEAVKIVENTFRDINIAFVNELAMSFSQLGINVNNVIDGAATKPFAFLPHYPGIGIGGHCIPVDPYYLIEYARGNGFEHEFLSLARSINEAMPVYAVDRLEQTLIEKTKKPLKGQEVAVLGLSYKANVADDRESPAYKVIEVLEERGAQVALYDPHFIDKSASNSAAETIKGRNAVILVTAHQEFLSLEAQDFEDVAVVMDGRNAIADKKEDLLNAGIQYLGIGS